MNASASVLLKYSHRYTGFFAIKFNGMLEINHYLIAGVCCYLAAFVLYWKLLDTLKLSYVQPVLTGATIALVVISSIILFKESFNMYNVIGLLLIVSGLFLVTMGY